MNDILFTPVRLSELESLIEKSVQRAFANNKAGPESSHTNEDILTVPQAAELLTLSVPTIYGLISRREIPYFKRGKRVYFLRQGLIDYLKAGRQKSRDEIKAEVERDSAKKIRVRK